MTVRQHERLICVDSEWQYSHLSFSNWSSPETFSYTNAASLIKEFTPFVNKHFSCYFLSKHHTKSSSHCNHGPRLTKTRQAFSIFCFEHSLNNCEWALQVERLWNSSDTTYRLDDVTYSYAFYFSFLFLCINEQYHSKIIYVSYVHPVYEEGCLKTLRVGCRIQLDPLLSDTMWKTTSLTQSNYVNYVYFPAL
jgi:hypothetical protein